MVTVASTLTICSSRRTRRRGRCQVCHDWGRRGLGGEDDLDEASLFTQGRRDLLDSLTGLRIASPSASASSRGVKLTRASKAALQQKDLLKSRKRQLATVLGALSHGDTLALDQALSTTYPLAKLTKGPNSKGPPVRLSRRHSDAKPAPCFWHSQVWRAAPLLALLPSESTAFHFTFECDSASELVASRCLFTADIINCSHRSSF